MYIYFICNNSEKFFNFYGKAGTPTNLKYNDGTPVYIGDILKSGNVVCLSNEGYIFEMTRGHIRNKIDGELMHSWEHIKNIDIDSQFIVLDEEIKSNFVLGVTTIYFKDGRSDVLTKPLFQFYVITENTAAVYFTNVDWVRTIKEHNKELSDFDISEYQEKCTKQHLVFNKKFKKPSFDKGKLGIYADRAGEYIYNHCCLHQFNRMQAITYESLYDDVIDDRIYSDFVYSYLLKNKWIYNRYFSKLVKNYEYVVTGKLEITRSNFKEYINSIYLKSKTNILTEKEYNEIKENILYDIIQEYKDTKCLGVIFDW